MNFNKDIYAKATNSFQSVNDNEVILDFLLEADGDEISKWLNSNFEINFKLVGPDDFKFVKDTIEISFSQDWSNKTLTFNSVSPIEAEAILGNLVFYFFNVNLHYEEIFSGYFENEELGISVKINYKKNNNAIVIVIHSLPQNELDELRKKKKLLTELMEKSNTNIVQFVVENYDGVEKFFDFSGLHVETTEKNHVYRRDNMKISIPINKYDMNIEVEFKPISSEEAKVILKKSIQYLLDNSYYDTTPESPSHKTLVHPSNEEKIVFRYRISRFIKSGPILFIQFLYNF